MIAPKLVHALAEATPEDWGVNAEDGLGRCIEASKYATLLFRSERIDCQAIAADALAFNALGIKLMDANVPMDSWPDAAWSVGLECERVVQANSTNEPGRKRGFGGHVVVVGADWFLDLTAIQLARPKKLIIIPGAIVGPYRPGDTGWVRRDLPVGGALQYRFRPEFKSWRTTHAWRANPDREYLAAMRDAMHRALARVSA